jgi:hypothetical protein
VLELKKLENIISENENTNKINDDKVKQLHLIIETN